MKFARALLIVASLALGYCAYDYHEMVDMHVNTVGPVNNYAEIYNYFKLPWCPPVGQDDSQRLGEVLAGEEKAHANYNIRFKVNTEWAPVCTKSLSAAETNQFIDAIENNYWFEFFVDGLSVKGPVGGKTSSSAHGERNYFLVSHLHFNIAYKGSDVIAVNITTFPSEAIQLKHDTPTVVEFSYSTKFHQTDTDWVDRHTLHRMFELEDSQEIHWLSVLNTLVMVVLLVGFLAINLVRVLRNDIAAYVDLDDQDIESEDDSGWKLLHADVFRAPEHPMLLSAAIGSGTQIFVMAVCVLIMALFDAFSPHHSNRGAVYAAFIGVFAATSGVAGYVATTYFVRWGGDTWVINTVLTSILFAGPAWFMFAVANTTAIVYDSTVALPFGTILLMLLLVVLVHVPLTVYGSWKALSAAKTTPYKPPCKTKRVAREIPPTEWYSHWIMTSILGALLPFSSIYIEVHYIYNSIWGPRVYTLFGMLGITLVMLFLVAGAVSIGIVYFKLVQEDYHWQWRSFMTSSWTGWLLYVYSYYYFTSHSEMSGNLQTIFFFSYTFLISYAVFLMLGSVGYHFGSFFVHKIYSQIKSD